MARTGSKAPRIGRRWLPGGDTIAVLADGVDRFYPAGHRELLEQVAGVGLLVSEAPPGGSPTRHRFLARGRLLAALSEASVVVEAGARSGALHRALDGLVSFRNGVCSRFIYVRLSAPRHGRERT